MSLIVICILFLHWKGIFFFFWGTKTTQTYIMFEVIFMIFFFKYENPKFTHRNLHKFYLNSSCPKQEFFFCFFYICQILLKLSNILGLEDLISYMLDMVTDFTDIAFIECYNYPCCPPSLHLISQIQNRNQWLECACPNT